MISDQERVSPPPRWVDGDEPRPEKDEDEEAELARLDREIDRLKEEEEDGR